MRGLAWPALVAALLVPTGLASPAAAEGTETVTVASVTADSGTTPTVGEPVSVRVHVDGAVTPPSIQLTRTDPDGRVVYVGSPQPVDGDGDVTVGDTPDERGSVTYTASDLTNPGATVVPLGVDVAGLPTALTLTASRPTVGWGRTVTLTARLVGSDGSPVSTQGDVTVSATPQNRSRTVVGTPGPPDASGTVVVTYTMRRHTTFTASYAGDDTYDPASAAPVTVHAKGILTARLRGGYATRDGVRLYHRSAAPHLVADLVPAKDGTCLYFRAQRRYGGAWHTVSTSGCVRTDSTGEAIGVLQPPHVLDRRYRVRAQWGGTSAVLGAHSAWQQLEFPS